MNTESQQIFYFIFSGKDYPSKVSLFLWAKDIVNHDEMADLKNIYIFLTDIEAVNLV